jgi:hypothetical protein
MARCGDGGGGRGGGGTNYIIGPDYKLYFAYLQASFARFNKKL